MIDSTFVGPGISILSKVKIIPTIIPTIRASINVVRVIFIADNKLTFIDVMFRFTKYAVV